MNKNESSRAQAGTIVVYGDSMAGVAAAAKAARYAPSHKVVLICPCLSGKIGGLGTTGGQNFFDLRLWNGSHPQKGTFSWLLYENGQFYNTDVVADKLYQAVVKYPNASIITGYDILNVSTTLDPFKVTSIELRNIYRDESSGLVKWGSASQFISGDIFIDASDDARLARYSNWGGTTGRYDWPTDYLGVDEIGPTGRARQQVATLMFKMKGIQTVSGDINWSKDLKTGAWGGWGGSHTYKTNPLVNSFNNTYGPLGYAIKPINLAENGPSKGEFWVNTLLVFDVDGRAQSRDAGTWRYPSDKRSDYKEADQAWVDARNFIKNNPDFIGALRQFPGFESASFVMDATGNPVVGESLYIRETVHSAISSINRQNGTENTNYGVTTNESVFAGKTPTTGEDQSNYVTRIGLAFYWFDINAYQFSDLKDASGQYGVVTPTQKCRSDIQYPADPNPVYIPYKTLTTNYVANLLLPGYGTSMGAFSWSEARVLPNLLVLGDAAGVAAAYSLNNGKQPLYLTQNDIAAIQNILVNHAGARLEK